MKTSSIKETGGERRRSKNKEKRTGGPEKWNFSKTLLCSLVPILELVPVVGLPVLLARGVTSVS